METKHSLKTIAGESGGAFGDLGTFLPYVLGALTVAGLAPAGVMIGVALLSLTLSGAIGRVARWLLRSAG